MRQQRRFVLRLTVSLAPLYLVCVLASLVCCNSRKMKIFTPTPVTALLLFSILLPSKALTSAADACAAIGAAFQAGQVVPIKSALACVYSFPYDSNRSAAIVDTLYKTFDLHTYKDISTKSPTPEFDVNIDVLGSLQKINRTVYQNDFEFNLAVYSVINALNDANALYLPACYFFAFSSYTAFPLVKILNAARTGEVVKISSLGKHTELNRASLQVLAS